MKKYIFIILALTPLLANAYNLKVDGIYYNIKKVDGKSVAVVTFGDWEPMEEESSNDRYSGDIVIPETIVDHGFEFVVTQIGEFAFAGSVNLKSIILPQCLQAIKHSSFSGCERLTTIEIPNTVTTIEELAFYDCTLLESVTFGETLQSIGIWAFAHCERLKDVKFPQSLIKIGEFAFGECYGLGSIVIPNSVSSIDHNPFASCSNLKSIKVEIGNPVYDSRDECNAIIETLSNKLICGCQSTTIPNSVTIIGDQAFWGCEGLKSLSLPNSIEKVEDCAFGWCKGLRTLTIPNSVTQIGYSAFSCINLNLIISEIKNPFEIGKNTFHDNAFMNATLKVPTGTKSIYESTNYWNLFQNIVDDGSSSIEEIKASNIPHDVYDLHGKMVRQNARTVDEFPKGVYIVEEKKVFIK